MKGLLAALALGSTVFAAGSRGAENPAATTRGRSFDLEKIQHVVVIYQENWSYDALYGSFPRSNGYALGRPVVQLDLAEKPQPIRTLPPALYPAGAATLVDPRFPFTQRTALFDMKKFMPVSGRTGDLIHAFYTEQLQINGGRMDGFVAWTNNPGLVLGSFDASRLPEGRLAAEYVMCDNNFHSAFGGSYLNHLFFISAQMPVWPEALTARKASDLIARAGAPSAITAATVEFPARSGLLRLPTVSKDGRATYAKARADALPDPVAPAANVFWRAPLNPGFAAFDNSLSVDPTARGGKDYYSVNTTQPSNWPFEVAGPFLPLLTGETIGDRLSAARVSWKWYAEGWDKAMAGEKDTDGFATHHQPFNYYANYAPGTPGRQHLVDFKQIATDLAADRLPAVAFVKFGESDEHPGRSLMTGQQAVADLVGQIQKSPAWASTLIVITYDENGGRWDHVSPPVIKDDPWGPGTRVPMILVSPFVKRHFVDHTPYETVSVLRFIEDRWKLAPLGTRDAQANSFTAAFDPAK